METEPIAQYRVYNDRLRTRSEISFHGEGIIEIIQRDMDTGKLLIAKISMERPEKARQYAKYLSNIRYHLRRF